MEWAGYLVGVALVSVIIGGAVLVACVTAGVYGMRHLIYAAKGEPYVPLLPAGKKRPFRYLDETECSADDVMRVLKKYLNTDVVGTYARAGLSALEADQNKGARYHAVLGSKFAKGSLSWEKFAAAATDVHTSVLHNCTVIANRVQTFDHVDYRNNERAFHPALLKRNPQPTATQLQKRNLYQTTLNDLNALVAANNSLLLELDRLTAELDKLDNIESADGSTRVVEEIRSLIEETKYYTQQLNAPK